MDSPQHSPTSEAQLILGNSNKKFSGVTSTMLQVLPHQQKKMSVAVLGNHNLPKGVPSISFMKLAKLCKNRLPNGYKRVFHARRNDEMIQAILLKKLFKAQIIPVFTSTAQRHHSRFTKWLMSQMDSIITTCSGASYYLENPAEVMIPHGVDMSVYTPAEDKEAAWNDLHLSGKYGIGIFGRVRHQKGIDILVDAIIPLLQKNPYPTVVIVGETTNAKHQAYLNVQLNKLYAAGVGERVVVLGKRPFKEIPKLFRAMSLVVALSRNEGFGLTVPEAMASGTAVIASHAGAWQDIVRHGIDGYTVPCDNVEETRTKLGLMLADPTFLIEMGKSGHQRIAEKFTVEREADALCEHFDRLQRREFMRFSEAHSA